MLRESALAANPPGRRGKVTVASAAVHVLTARQLSRPSASRPRVPCLPSPSSPSFLSLVEASCGTREKGGEDEGEEKTWRWERDQDRARGKRGKRPSWTVLSFPLASSITWSLGSHLAFGPLPALHPQDPLSFWWLAQRPGGGTAHQNTREDPGELVEAVRPRPGDTRSRGCGRHPPHSSTAREGKGGL